MGRFASAVSAFDRQNAEDPNKIRVGSVERPRELVQAERLAAWVDRLRPDAPEPLLLAARCQHLRRWEIPRTSYAEGRIGYLEWRKALARFHADHASAILRDAGYDESSIERVRTINHKRGIKVDADVQTMEDALCLSFLEHELDDFIEKHSHEKVVDILQKTWRKMSEQGHSHALTLEFSERARQLVETALGD